MRMDELYRNLEEAIGEPKYDKPKRRIGLQLIYKASKDGLSTDTFHTKCDNKGPTITLLHGVKNTWYGGYTSESWTSEIATYKPDKTAFLFWKQQVSGSKLNIMPITDKYKSNAIMCCLSRGPTFGWCGLTKSLSKQYDLQTFTNKEQQTFTNKEQQSKNNVFKLDGHLHIENGSYTNQGYTSAQINGGTMDVNDLEVYQVYDDELHDGICWIKPLQDPQGTRRYAEEMKPVDGFGIACYNVLLLGVIGSGKSSLCNTIRSTMMGEVTKAASVGNLPNSITTTLRVYTVPNKQGGNLKMQLFDVRGVEAGRGYEHEINHLLQGTLRVGYRFPDQSRHVGNEDIIPAEGLTHAMHLVCFTADATKIDVQGDVIKDVLLKTQRAPLDEGIPRMCVLTRIDELCPNVDKVYTSKSVHDAVRTAAGLFGMEKSEVYPVCNYTNEKEVDKKKDSLVLQVVKGMIDSITGYLLGAKGAISTKDSWTKRGKELMTEKEDLIKKQIIAELEGMKRGHNIKTMLVGDISTGKSSFVNTLTTAFRGRICKIAPVGTLPEGTTFQLREYKQKLISCSGDEEKPLPVTICDIPGFSKDTTPEDIESVVKGHVPNRAEMTKPVTPDLPRYRKKPTIADQVHCVYFVFDISQIDSLDKKKGSVKTIATMLTRAGIPRIAVLTNCDKVWPGILEHLQDMYASQKIKECAEKVAQMCDISIGDVYPVVNYVDQTEPDGLMNVLALEAFKRIVSATSDYLDNCSSDDEEEE